MKSRTLILVRHAHRDTDLGRERDNGLSEKGKEGSLLSKLQRYVQLDKDPSFADYEKFSNKARSLLVKLNEKFQAEARLQYKPGDFVANVGAKSHQYYGHTPTAIDLMHLKLVTPYTHGAKIFVSDNGEVNLSHVLMQYTQSKYEFYEDGYSDVWRLDISSMLRKKQQELMLKVYGENWKDEIQKK